MAERGRKALFLLLAWPLVVRAALRLWWLERGRRLDDLADRLRQVPRLRVPGLANPAYLAGCADRLLALIPAPDFGPCLKRSLLLLDLWSRCGLEPTLTIGMVGPPAERQFHAWVSVGCEGLDPVLPHREAGPRVIWSG